MGWSMIHISQLKYDEIDKDAPFMLSSGEEYEEISTKFTINIIRVKNR